MTEVKKPQIVLFVPLFVIWALNILGTEEVHLDKFSGRHDEKCGSIRTYAIL